MRLLKRIFSLQSLVLLIALVLLWLAVRAVSLREMVDIVRRIDLGWLGLIILLDIGVLVSISIRWWFVLWGFGHRLSLLRLIRYRTTVFGLSYITPGPQMGGEVLQVYYPSAAHDVPTSVALAATTVDKSLELLGNFTFLAIGTFIVLVGQHLISRVDTYALAGLSLLLLIPVGIIVAIWRGRHPLSGILGWLAHLVPTGVRRRLRATRLMRAAPTMQRARQTVHRSEDLVAWLCRTRPSTLVWALVLTLAAWFFMLADFWAITRALHLPLTPAQAVGALVLVFFSFLLPVPGGLGAMEAALVLAFTAYGYTPTEALSMALLMRVRDITQAAIGLALGGVHLWGKNRGITPPRPAGSKHVALHGEP